MKKQIMTLATIATCLAQVNLNLLPSAPNLDNKGYILVAENTSKIIAAQNAEQTIEPASLTKLMTLFIVATALEQKTINLDDQVLVSKKAWKQPGSRMFIKAGDHVPVKLLIQGSATVSGNDATVALAEHIAGSEEKFVELMNTTASKLGMKNTHFNNSTGLPTKNHITTPHDLAILAEAWYEDYPEKTKWFAQKYFTYNKIKQHNRNQQLWSNQLVDGMKTGYTKAAGYCLVTSAKDGDERLIAVIAGAKSKNARFEQSTQLLNYGFHFYATKTLASPAVALGTVPVYLGTKDSLAYTTSKSLIITAEKNSPNVVKVTTHVKSNLKAPIHKGEKLGTAEISFGDNKNTVDIIAFEDIEKSSFFQQAISYSKMLLN